MKLLLLFLIVLQFSGFGAWASPQAANERLPLEDFLGRSDLDNVRLSPNGKYFSATVSGKDKKSALVVFDAQTRAITNTIGVATVREMIGNYAWVSDERLVVSFNIQLGGQLTTPVSTGELAAVNADGSKKKLLHSWRGDRQVGTNIKRVNTSQQTFARMVDPLRLDDDNIIISTSSMNRSADGDFDEVHLLNVMTGTRKRLGRAPVRDASFLVDDAGQVRVATAVDSQQSHKVYVRQNNDSDWSLRFDQDKDAVGTYPIALSSDGKTLLVQREHATGPAGVYRVGTDAGELELVYRDPVVDPSGYNFGPDGRELIGIVYDSGVPRVQVVGSTPEAKLLRGLQKSFSDSLVQLSSYGAQGGLALVEVQSGSNSGDFYVYNRADKKANYLASRREALDPDALGSIQPVSMKARDGMQLHGYLTVPRGMQAKGLPVLVWVHGGPHSERDFGLFHRDAMLFANFGYATLRVNFRGSDGYGKDFMRAGHREWGAKMQDDVTDATRWLIEQGIADPKRVCIGGASFGGYAAVMGGVREPDLYRCIISYLGVHDLELMFARGDIEDSVYGQNYLELVVGKDQKMLRERSPINFVERIKAPVFIAAGGADDRVPKAHAERLHAALEKAGKPVELLIKTTEGHGYYDQENQIELYQKMLAFMDAHIGAD